MSAIDELSIPAPLQGVAEKYWQQLLEMHKQPETLQPLRKRAVPLFALSDFVARSCIQEPELLERLLGSHLVPEQPDYADELDKLLRDVSDEDSLKCRLRHFRRLHMVRLAWLDLSGQLPIDEALHQVSQLSDVLISKAYDWCYQHLSERYGSPMLDGRPQPMLILGMGKLGGRELNFSSDIDLIFCYPAPGETSGGRKVIENQQFFTKLGQKLIGALDSMTADGRVFRVDMRLRPFGDSGPLVTHFSALEDYYQEQGREWERYAMVKARVINPDGQYSEELRTILRPFVFRRYIDFSAIEALRNMKRLISQEVRRRQLSGNIKLGAGGIREVEFIVQTFQLIRGGREQELQQPNLLSVLSVLKKRQWLEDQDADRLAASYRFLRRTEHCLQELADEQTQTLPDNEEDRLRLSLVMGFADYNAFLQHLNDHMRDIHCQFQELIGDEQESHGSKDASDLHDLWTLPLSDEEAHSLLEKHLSAELAEQFWRALNGFASDIRQRSMGKRGRETLDKLMPWMLAAVLDKSEKPTTLLERLLHVIKSVCRRTTYLELLLENPGALAQLVRLCDASPWIAEQVSRFPILLDELLSPQHLYELVPQDSYASELRQFMLRIPEQDLEAQMEGLRQFKLSQQLKIAAADITGVLPVMKVSDHLTFLAEALIRQVVLDAWQQMVQRYGRPHGIPEGQTGFAVIGYGKLGGWELGYGSDLDLVFLHNCDSNADTDGPKPIESRQFYLKLAQRVMHLFNTKTASGDLYETDLRLRPSGNAGLLVCHMDAFGEYLHKEAWTWEHQALARSRFVFGDDSLATTFAGLRRSVLCLPRNKQKLAAEVREMREKMRSHLEKSQGFDLKQGSGGIADIEFLTQFWVLSESHRIPEICYWSDNVRILESLKIQAVIKPEVAEQLTQAYLAYRNAGHRFVLQGQPAIVDSDEFEQMRDFVRGIWEQTLGRADRS
ncbi:bifunctional [glutamate--ammonia ligase]-adenylyl-L-tyrosine phosphorylase/[glutamate--ammonia-ligase] adenylyltransferase [Bowmanella dokdonensis]|uniref:Bifunctional glutamine synthetase adenylyltransferase/adenylyl-removing enzyme n=1 Tax=Bowmanella dokdonensis TaxID=751969 RepID=A0A939ISF2_9ALTE|nr:bifunctional [glutamate--ammonia ligase]-adenylyl-L-tyrosine phosphorylase/[glutamate--ammonia-ligase] adenylyltransferase [Bowmanella dokdonensis]MBN7826667.1 bifunctional [glutamate--ammonia ligase]-adenylyl-L-tyrosine phosphorylase/[glutamate--ammonia-ligase] adenylyltransferase [Bowmanella dokdonensis]